MTLTYAIEISGTVAFAMSGAFAGMKKRLDWFGVLSIAFVTAVGGGTIRDVLIGNTPVSWMHNITIPLLILGATIVAILFRHTLIKLTYTLFLFDTVGLGLFTLIGINKGLLAGLNPVICIILGTITGCFGGVLRDLLLNQIPILFRKEIYATACIAGGLVYFGGVLWLPEPVVQLGAIVVICLIRILAVIFNWQLRPLKK